jgi:hypothetical protein
MARGNGRSLKLLGLVAAASVVMILAPGGLRLFAFAEAATRSTSQFRASSTDPRVAYEPGAEAMAEEVAAALPAAVETVEQRQGGPFAVPVRVYVCATVDRFVQYGANPRAGGFTIDHRVFLSPKPENTAERVPRLLTHELSHLHLGARRGALRFAQLPVWFVEGLGVEVSGGGGAEGVTDGELRRAIAQGRTFVPETAGSVFRSRGASAYGLDAHMFYGQAGMFVGYLRSLDGARFQTVLHAVEEGAALGPAFESTYGFAVEVAWRRFVAEARAGSAAGPPGP